MTGSKHQRSQAFKAWEQGRTSLSPAKCKPNPYVTWWAAAGRPREAIRELRLRSEAGKALSKPVLACSQPGYAICVGFRFRIEKQSLRGLPCMPWLPWCYAVSLWALSFSSCHLGWLINIAKPSVRDGTCLCRMHKRAGSPHWVRASAADQQCAEY